MKVEEKDLGKVDPLLREALVRAKGDEVLRAVFLLGGTSKEAHEVGAETGPSPDEFPSRTAYRRAKIAQRQKAVAREIHDTLQALEELSLAPRGGKMGRAVVVEGPARQVSAALGLAGVVHASLDRPIELIKPRRRKGTEPKQR